jgi:hypothetical protein
MSPSALDGARLNLGLAIVKLFKKPSYTLFGGNIYFAVYVYRKTDRWTATVDTSGNRRGTFLGRGMLICTTCGLGDTC